MIAAEPLPLGLLYERDETAWLDAMSALVAERRFAEMDVRHLSEYLADMSKRDRREVRSRLIVLLLHLLKWEHQLERRTGSWRATIMEQRGELRFDLESGTLYNYAVTILADAFAEARKRAAAETELPLEAFPTDCPWDIDGLMVECLRANTAP